MDTAAAQLTPSAVAPVNVNKTDLQKTLKLLQSFDLMGSPYVGIQFAEGKPAFYRSSDNGYAHSKEFTNEEVFVHLQHFIEYLKQLPEDVELSVAPNGVLRLYGVNGNFNTTMHVHTVLKGQAGLTQHKVAGRQVEIKSDAFAGLDVSYIRTLSKQPIIRGNQLMIPVNTGAIIWSGLDSLAPTHSYSPMFSFLRLISGEAKVEDLYVSENGYWRAVVEGIEFYMKGHAGDTPFFRRMTLPGKELGNITSEALLRGLNGASSMIGDSDFLALDPVYGVTVQDKFGNAAQWTLDQGLSFPKFRITGAQAKMIVGTIKQTTDEFTQLADVITDTVPYLRFTRGKFAVNITL